VATRKLRALAFGLALAGVLMSAVGARAETLEIRQNLANLIEEAEVIIHGDVVSVTDGIENNIPYTEVRIKVRESLRGSAGEVYTFRQFGLTKPRSLGNGLVSYNTTPVGWPTYEQNEEVVLFLYKPARKTGLRTTAGLRQGKLKVKDGQIVSQQNNEGLFDGFTVDASVLDKDDAKMLKTKRGPVDAGAFVKLVRRAVKENWVETRRMTNEN
jgi:hypothetical protein